MERLCEDCGIKLGRSFYVVKYQPDPLWRPDESLEKAVCFECHRDYAQARLVTETPAQIAAMFQGLDSEPTFDNTAELWQISSRLMWGVK